MGRVGGYGLRFLQDGFISFEVVRAVELTIENYMSTRRGSFSLLFLG